MKDYLSNGQAGLAVSSTWLAIPGLGLIVIGSILAISVALEIYGIYNSPGSSQFLLPLCE